MEPYTWDEIAAVWEGATQWTHGHAKYFIQNPMFVWIKGFPLNVQIAAKVPRGIRKTTRQVAVE